MCTSTLLSVSVLCVRLPFSLSDYPSMYVSLSLCLSLSLSLSLSFSLSLFLSLCLSMLILPASSVSFNQPWRPFLWPKEHVSGFLADPMKSTLNDFLPFSQAGCCDLYSLGLCSTWQGHAATVTSSEEVKAVIATLLLNGKIARATHNIMAYRIKLDNGAILQVYEHGDVSRTCDPAFFWERWCHVLSGFSCV